MNRLVLGTTLAVAAQLCAAGLLLTSAWLIVRAAEQPPVMYLMVAIVGVRFFGIARTALRYAERLVTHDVALRRVVDLRIEVYAALERRVGLFGTSDRRGDVVRRVVADVDAVQDRLLRIRGPWIVAIATSLVVTAVVTTIDLTAGFLVAAGATVAMGLVRLSGPDPWATELAEERGRAAAETSAAVFAARELVAAGLPAAQARSAVHDVAALERRRAWRAGRAHLLVLWITAAVAGLLALNAGALDPILIGVVVLAPLALAEPIEALVDAERLRPDVVAAERRLAALVESGPLVSEPDSATKLPRSADLAVSDLSVGWSSDVASGLSFVLPEGAAMVVTGPSGSGKTALALTLTKYLALRNGSITLGGVPLEALDSGAVRSTIGLLSQDEMVFDTTVRENLRIARPEATDVELRTALEQAGLGAWLDGTTAGLDTMAGEHGSALSGGERQRLSLARLLLAGRRILIVDEPTEHLDQRLADQLLEDLLDLAPAVSLIIITHDPRVIARLDHRLELSAAARPRVML